ncbi:MAG TPA: amidohydrolase family protein [Anaerovoracaceae bacterium]|nr:amidohydrolase family protein [Anaerovoracaceae bacterium]
MLVLKTNRVIVGDGKQVIENAAVVLGDDGTIADLGTWSEIKERHPEVPVKFKENCTILPGLIDMHVHIGFYDRRQDADAIRDNLGHKTLIAYKNMQDALSVGITTLRSVAEPKGLGSAIRAGLHKEYIKGPRYFTCERGIAITGGHGTRSNDKVQDTVIEADGEWEVRKAVRQNLKDGADWIKVLSSHREHYSEYTLVELQAVVNEVHRFNKKCCIHAATRQAIELAVIAGFDTIEHGAFLTPDLAEAAAKKGVAWIPTAYIYMYAAEYLKEKIRESGHKPTKSELTEIGYFEDSINAYKNNFLENFKRGILIAAGTDIVFPDHHITPIVEEIETLCILGLQPIQAIQCATNNAAKILGKDKEFGLIQKGLYADLLIVEGNPLNNISDLRNVKEVYKEGELLYNK